MATQGYLLSEKKLRELNDLLDTSHTQKVKKTPKKPVLQTLNDSTEILLIQTPNDEAETNGIDALVKKTGTEDYDHPGFAECDICQITPSVTTGKDFDVVPISDTKRIVFNLSETPIEKSKQLLAVKDKFGNWIAAQSGSSLNYTQIVTVENKSSTEEDWPAWSPIGVCVLSDSQAATIAQGWKGSLPTLPGCRLDDYSFDSGKNRLLGITQEPIAYGETGSVCIRGITPALMQIAASPWTGESLLTAEKLPWLYVNYDATDVRWSMRPGHGGDVRLLQVLDSTAYTDDEYLVLVDLCEVPNRLTALWFGSGTLPACSLMRGRISPAKFATISSISTKWLPWTVPVCSSPNWSVASTSGNDRYVWFYEASEEYAIQAISYYTTLSQGVFGPAPGSYLLWPGLPGFDWIANGWYRSGATAGQDYKIWVKKNLNHLVTVKANGLNCASNSWLTTGGAGLIYDGTEQFGITYPLAPAGIPSWNGINNTCNGTQTAFKCGDPNIPDGRFFTCRYDNMAQYYQVEDISIWDDPIGTLKMWIGAEAAIPPGWRRYTALNGAYPKGYGTFGGSAPTHAHDGVTTGGGTSSSAACDVPSASVYFIERYQ